MSARPQISADASAEARATPRRLRTDAERNRAAIVGAAQDVFAERGLDAPLEEIAARAGVGIATLYRRFPSRQQLVAAALAGKITPVRRGRRAGPGLPRPVGRLRQLRGTDLRTAGR